MTSAAPGAASPPLQLGLSSVWTSARQRGYGLGDVARWMASAPATLVGLSQQGRGSRSVPTPTSACSRRTTPSSSTSRALHHKNPVTPYAGRPLAGVVRSTWLRGERIDINAEPQWPAPEQRREMNDFTQLPDLASRALAGSVVYANDELFAERENLIKPGRAVFSTEDFGHKGKVYDGWETRRRREPGHDGAIVRLGVPGVVHGVVIDTSWFKGNYPPLRLRRRSPHRGLPLDRGAARGRLGDTGPALLARGRRRQPLRGVAGPSGHPRAAVDLPRRRRRPLPGARRAPARPGAADRHDRPCRRRERRSRRRLLRTGSTPHRAT